MKKYLFLFILLSSFTFSCSDDNISIPDINNDIEEQSPIPLNEDYVEPGVFRIKLTPEAEASLRIETSENGVINTGIESLDQLCLEKNVIQIKRTFRHGGKHEGKMRKAELHLWYDIYFEGDSEESFSEQNSMNQLRNSVLQIPEASIVEPVLKIKRIKSDTNVLTPETIETLEHLRSTTSSELPKIGSRFNDPYLKYQWHYHNEGTLNKSLPGADINLLKAWEIETGKPQVIVAVIDGGIEVTHPDLKQNLWVNEAELNGVEGVDDNNPDAPEEEQYIDDIHGYNFVLKSGDVSAHEHGTHVAGTVAAVTNNGIGGAGVAGGNGNVNSGIRLMSCQIFAYDDEGTEVVAEDNKHEAFIYAANNGAVIAQNSWSYNWTGSEIDILESDKAAIDYFIEYAGTDENGNQVGPMKGGIVIFATGNDNLNKKVVPASYERIFSVSSFASNYTKAPYSNYGSWVHVAAPGGSGEYAAGTQIFSTFMLGQYGFQEGTSMACPHVSGIAALIVSKFGVNADGTFNHFTNEELKARLLYATNDYLDWYNASVYPMGKGYINAYKALADEGELAPDRITELQTHWVTDKVTLSWRVTADSDDPLGKAHGFKILMSEEDLYGLDFGKLPAVIDYKTVYTGLKTIGETISIEINNLKEETTYYISIAAFDEDGNISLSSTVQGATVPNRAPVVTGLPDIISLRKDDIREIVLSVNDPESDSWTYSFVAGSNAAGITRVDNTLVLRFNATNATPGQNYEGTLTLTDSHGAENKLNINYLIENNAPTLLQSFQDITMQYLGEEKMYSLTEYFIDKDNDAVTYEVTSTNQAVATASISSDNLVVTAAGVGTSRITIVAEDPYGERTSTAFDIICRDENRDVDLYPVPVKKDGILNIRMGRFVNGNIDVTLYSASGAKVYEQTTEISPDNPAQVNISNLNGGNYQVVIKYKQQEFTKNITKL